MKRITVIMPDDTHEKVINQAEKEKRKKSSMCAVLIERGLPKNEVEDNEPLLSYQQRIADGMVKKKDNG